jgi:uncharacterized RDD family membrane protein YckC
LARWRDVKQGKVDTNEDIKTPLEDTPCFCNAPLASRFKAFITDAFMLLMPIMYLVFYIVMGSREEFADDRAMGWVYIFLPHMIITIGFWFKKGQTPGLKAYEGTIVDKNTGERPLLIWLFNRYLLTAIVIIMPLFWLVPFFNKRRLTLQDYLSGTCVKHTPNEPILTP